jgi:hypothetical protein
MRTRKRQPYIDLSEFIEVEHYKFNHNIKMENYKRFAISSLTTFIASFGIFFFSVIQDESFTFTSSALASAGASALMVAVRALAKVVVEFLTGFNR